MPSSRRFLTVLSTFLAFGCVLIPAAASADGVPVGEAPTLPPGATTLGAVAPQQELNLFVALEPRDPAGLESFATEVSTPGSPLYGQYLSVEGFADRFGAAPAQVARVRTALQARGLTVGAPSENNLSLPVEATAAEAEVALGTSFERVRTPDGRVAFANTSAPEVPAAAAPYVAGILGLDDLNVPQNQAAPRAEPSRPGPSSPSTAGTTSVLTGVPQPCADAIETREEFESGYTTDQIASAYSLTGYYAAGNFGAGQTIALLEEEPYLPADIAEFQKCYGTHAGVEPVDINGGPGPYKEEDGGESELDIEQLIGLAPEADIVVYQGPNESSTTTQILSTWITENRAKVMSSSWGLCEKETDPAEFSAISTLLQEAAAQGQSFFVAAGDDGATDCYDSENPDKAITVDYPGSDPFATDVGGTRLESATAPTVQYIWSDGTKGGAGGGGVSAHWGMPSYQAESSPSLNVVSPLAAGTTCGLPGYCREVPDVSAEADPDTSYVVFTERKWGETGGTSAAAPLWAAFATLANASPACGGKAIGFANPALYSIGGAAYEANFDDVVGSRPGGLKSNDIFDDTKPFFPGSHYDMATGIGTPIGTTLGGSLCALANPPVPPAPPTPPAPSDSGTNKPTATPAPSPAPLAHLKTSRLAGVAKGAPKLTLGLEARQGAKIEAVTIAMPPGLRLAATKEDLATGIVARAGGKRLKVAVRRVGKSIQVRLLSPNQAISLKVASPALSVTDKLRERVRTGKTKKLGLVATTKETGGQNSRFPQTLTL
ncbi:MAG: S8/S53 family peptidase [Actinobacteria bacterium]|nr:S8/S53 family peptidase [Actinomycetota bacterium]